MAENTQTAQGKTEATCEAKPHWFQAHQAVQTLTVCRTSEIAMVQTNQKPLILV
jgi:hypothetical protein